MAEPVTYAGVVRYFWSDAFASPGMASDRRNLYRYSPYHNIRAGVTYPA
jgi:prolyl oligopeptidase